MEAALIDHVELLTGGQPVEQERGLHLPHTLVSTLRDVVLAGGHHLIGHLEGSGGEGQSNKDRTADYTSSSDVLQENLESST